MAAYRELSAAEREQYEAALRVSHRVRTVVNVYDRDETFVRRLGGKVVAGQVDVDGRNDISRSLSLPVADPSNRFLFERRRFCLHRPGDEGSPQSNPA